MDILAIARAYIDCADGLVTFSIGGTTIVCNLFRIVKYLVDDDKADCHFVDAIEDCADLIM